MNEMELKQHIELAEKGPKRLAGAVSGLSDKVLRYSPAPGKWSILQIIAHLADVEIVYSYRLRQILADENPVIARIDQDAWARNLGYLESLPAELVAQFGVNRHHNLRLLRRLTPSDLSKGARHPEMDRPMTAEDLVRRFVSHDDNHLGQIETLKKAAAKS
jgi:uncharacterized damage-inducible protein DinB